MEDPLIGAATEHPWTLSMLAEILSVRLGDLGERGLESVRREALERPLRWREPLRLAVREGHPDTRYQAALLLDRVGEMPDVGLLRTEASRFGDTQARQA